ncbi:hypothetical protein AYI68_g3420 [Smittium mucronatum]|uniref:Uncharacterized protein n=1 Tax=Smittium mucronatum TaxID=133383 RepID=A0A1R0H029_9FUNG|nr:hypothetical protein AYI68_g3420 [Smittium mucronatum]
MKPSSNEPLMNPAVLSKLMVTKKPTNSGGKKPFRWRQQYAASQAAPNTVTIAATAPVTNQTNLADGSNQQFTNYTGGFRGHETHEAQSSQGHDTGDCGYIVQKGNRGGIPAITGILLEYICGSKEIRGTSSCSGHEATKRTPEEDAVRNRTSVFHQRDDPQEGLLEVLALLIERESIPVLGPTILDDPITAGFYQNLSSSNTMCSPAKDQIFRIPGRPFDNDVFKRIMFEINNVCFEKTGQSWLQNQLIKNIASAHAVNSAPRYEDQHQVHDALGTRKQGLRPPENSNRNDKSWYVCYYRHCVVFKQGPSNGSGDTSEAPEAPRIYVVEDQLFEGQPEMDVDSHNKEARIG